MRSTYDLETPRGEDWRARAACAHHDPEAWFPPDLRMSSAALGALHVCQTHCPVRVQCHADAERQIPWRRTRVILGGVLYDAQGHPKTAHPPARCSSCEVK